MNKDGDQGLHPSIAHIMQFFTYEHLPEHLQKVSRPFGDLAIQMVGKDSNKALTLEGPEATAGLRKLLEAKDCFVRAKLAAK